MKFGAISWFMLCSALSAASIVRVASAAGTDGAAANLEIVRGQIDTLNRGDFKAALQDFSIDTRDSGRSVSRGMLARIFADIFVTFPDWHSEILDIAAVGDAVIVRVKTSGTHKGIGKIPVNGGMLVGVAPTNRHFAVDATHWYRLKEGKIVDHYATRDDLGMLQQLGLSEPPKPFDWAKLAVDANTHVLR